MRFAKTHGIQTYVVQGSGPFPIDMLRYDSAWPASERDANMIAQTHEFGGERDAAPIHLKRAQADTYSMPGVDRWRSFGWTAALEVQS
jgi:hypothetical protein